MKLIKVDLKDGFWRVTNKECEGWNFAYWLPNHPGQLVEILVPAALQIGWAQFPTFFCAVSKTSRNVAEYLVHEPVGVLLQHPPEETGLDLPKKNSMKKGHTVLHMLEVFVDDCIQLAQTSDEKDLRHCSRAVLHGVHSVLPSSVVILDTVRRTPSP